MKLHRFFIERGFAEGAEDQTSLAQAPMTLSANQDRRVMSGIAIGQSAIAGKHAVDHRDKTTLNRATCEDIINMSDGPGRHAAHGSVAGEDALEDTCQ